MNSNLARDSPENESTCEPRHPPVKRSHILVTGGTGYIGSHTVVELLNAGHSVIVVDNFANSSPLALDAIRKISGRDFAFIEGDVADASVLDEAFGHLNLDWKQYVKIDPRYYRPTEVELLIGDATKAKEKLGWTPKYTLPELVKEMVHSDLELFRRNLLLKESGFAIKHQYE